MKTAQTAIDPNSIPLLLAGDIGATKTKLAIYQTATGYAPPLRQQTLQNTAFESFDTMLTAFLGEEQPRPSLACLGIAGPVRTDTVRLTNRNWLIDAAALRDHFGFTAVRLINDLTATASGIPLLKPADCHCLNRGAKRTDAAMAVLALGTGLGEALLLPSGDSYLAYPSEGGHASFAPRTAEQVALLAFLQQCNQSSSPSQMQKISVEGACSGLAVPDVFAFLATRKPVPAWLSEQVAQSSDPTPVLVQAALTASTGGTPCDIAVESIRLLLDILADEAANLALKTLALGGVFLGGGLAPRLLPLLDPQRFMAIFASGTQHDMLAQIPIHLILNPNTALLGAAAFAQHPFCFSYSP